MICAVIAIAGCTSPGTTQTETGPTAQEFEIAHYYHDQLWATPDVPEEQIQAEVADHFGISEKELRDIYGKVVDYNVKTTGRIGL